MKYIFAALLSVFSCCCALQTRGQALVGQPADTFPPQLDMARLAALDTATAYAGLHTYLLQQGWELVGPVDEGNLYSYWYDFNHYRDSTGRRRKDHFITVDVRKDKKLIVSINYTTTSAQQYLSLKSILKQKGFRISIDKENAYGGEVQTYVKEPVWAILVFDYPQPSRAQYKMTIELLDH